jgi:hypothetical protein
MFSRTIDRVCTTSVAVLVACATFVHPVIMSAQAVVVRHTQGTLHGFLILRTLKGDALANGDVIQTARGNRMTTQLVFHFKDGSIHDETAVFSQDRTFRLLSDHLIQKGPSFPHPLDVSINGSTGQVTVHSTNDKGKESMVTQRLALPPDVSNGVLLTLLMNLPSGSSQRKFSMVAATPKPRLIKLGRHFPRRGYFLGGRLKPQSHALRPKGRNWRLGRRGRANGRKTTAGHSRVDSIRRRSSRSQIRGSASL